MTEKKPHKKSKHFATSETKLLPRHQDVFMETAEEHTEMLKTTCHLRTWANTFRPQLTPSAKEATKVAVQDVIDIRECYRLENMQTNMGNVKTKIRTRRARTRGKTPEKPPKPKPKKRRTTLLRGRLKGMQTTRKFFVNSNTQTAGSAGSTGEG